MNKKKILNPYESVDFGTARQIKSMSHFHATSRERFDVCLADGYRHFAITNYQPSVPTYPLDKFFTNVPSDVIGSPNSEKVFTTEFGGNVHFNALGSFAEGHGHTLKNKVPWRVAFDEIFDALQYADGGGITLNHPVYPLSNPTGVDKFMEMLDYDERVLGIEVYNSSLRHLPYWDEILSTGRRCWGFAVVDWYNASKPNKTYGSNILLVPEFTEHECLKAYRSGSFYMQLKDVGLRFTDITLKEGALNVSVNRECTISFFTSKGNIKECVGMSAVCDIPEDDAFIRVEATELSDSDSHILSNPIML